MARVYKVRVIPKATIIGDPHGCYDELVELLINTGDISLDATSDHEQYFINNMDRKVIFVGDLNDRGPATDKVLELVMWLYENGKALVIAGNHDNKLFRYLKGNKVKPSHGLENTIEQLNNRSEFFRLKVLAFLAELPYMIETDDFIVVHGAYINTENARAQEAFAYYGVTNGSKDEQGYLVRDESWKTRYMGTKHVFHGHIALMDGQPSRVISPSGKEIWNLDTAACFGGRLTALSYPEMTITAVPARKVYREHLPNDSEYEGKGNQ